MRLRKRLTKPVAAMVLFTAAAHVGVMNMPSARAQSPQGKRESAPKLEFQVASVRPANPRSQGEALGLRGGPGSPDPARISFRSESLLNLLLRAFSLQPDRLSGPSWLISEYYDIAATLAPDTTTDQFKEMLRNLLSERFGLGFHYVKKDFIVYSLVVAKGGPKIKESPVDPNFPAVREDRPPKMVLGPDGFPELPAGLMPASIAITRNGVTSISARKQSLASLPRSLQTTIGGGARVINKHQAPGPLDGDVASGVDSQADEAQMRRHLTK
jgi:uncharacterized protein (TIGR03435 family)